MNAELSTAQHMAETARAIRACRSSLAQHFPRLTQGHREGVFHVQALLDGLPTTKVESPADALAVLTLMVELFAVLYENSTRNEAGEDAAGAIATAMLKLRDGLADASGLDPNTFAFTSSAVRPAA